MESNDIPLLQWYFYSGIESFHYDTDANSKFKRLIWVCD